MARLATKWPQSFLVFLESERSFLQYPVRLLKARTQANRTQERREKHRRLHPPGVSNANPPEFDPWKTCGAGESERFFLSYAGITADCSRARGSAKKQRSEEHT